MRATVATRTAIVRFIVTDCNDIIAADAAHEASERLTNGPDQATDSIAPRRRQHAAAASVWAELHDRSEPRAHRRGRGECRPGRYRDRSRSGNGNAHGGTTRARRERDRGRDRSRPREDAAREVRD